ncbi:hypothetical protein [Lentzea sp. E54]|uniref:hypothetical protein n=1 Tax=Lentzea xerophila TaxID=3435883 RepID=UPI003DA5CA1D
MSDLGTMPALLKIRAVPINVNYRYVRDELRYLYDNADHLGLVYDTEFARPRGRRPAARAPVAAPPGRQRLRPARYAPKPGRAPPGGS